MKLAAALALLSLLACRNGAGPEPPDDPAAGKSAVAPHMSEHFTRIVKVRDAVVLGDFEATRAPARWIAEHGAPEGVPASWNPMVADLRLAANGLDQAKKLDDVARALGPVIAACGGCHETLGTSVPRPETFSTTAPAGDTFDQRMARHVWALEQLWFGLIAPDSQAWQRGANQVAADNLHPPKGPAMPKDAKELEAVADRIRALGGEAQRANSTADRARVYGDMLSTCVLCHDLAKGGDDVTD